MPRVRHPEDGLVYACPKCDSTGHIRTRADPDDDELHCDDCGRAFDEANEREARSHGGGSIGPHDEVGQALARPDVTSWDDLADALGGGD